VVVPAAASAPLELAYPAAAAPALVLASGGLPASSLHMSAAPQQLRPAYAPGVAVYGGGAVAPLPQQQFGLPQQAQTAQFYAAGGGLTGFAQPSGR
jgi:hypothetical protein